MAIILDQVIRFLRTKARFWWTARGHSPLAAAKGVNQARYGIIKRPHVTATIPVYNEEDCITSLLKQDFEPLEILAVDDGCVENSARICENLKIRVLRGAHKGMGAAGNVNARNANGNILVLVDADMVFAPDYVSRLVAPIIRGEAIATCHWNEMVSTRDNQWARCQTWFNGLPARRRHPFAVAEYSAQYRAVRKDFFVDSARIAEEQGYKADISIYRRTGVYAKIVPDAGCFHRNIKIIASYSRKPFGTAAILPFVKSRG